MSDGRAYIKHGVMQTASGAVAGFVEVCMMQPLDLVKTRFQLQTAGGVAPQYTGVVDCMTKMCAREGALALWKGILPPIAAETPKNAVKFLSFEQYKAALTSYGGASMSPVVTLTLAGLGAGITEAVFINPFEVVKVGMQSNRDRMTHAPNTWAVTRDIIRTEGLFGLNKGLSATVGRHGVFNAFYFGFYHSVSGLLPSFESSSFAEVCRRFAIGLMAGTIASCLNIPFDVVKSRIQGPQPATGVKYRSMLASFATIYREEGVGAFYKGLVPKVLRLGPGGAILLVIYEYTYDFLAKCYPDDYTGVS